MTEKERLGEERDREQKTITEEERYGEAKKRTQREMGGGAWERLRCRRGATWPQGPATHRSSRSLHCQANFSVQALLCLPVCPFLPSSSVAPVACLSSPHGRPQPSPHLSRALAGAETAPPETNMAAQSHMPQDYSSRHALVHSFSQHALVHTFSQPWGTHSCCLTLRGHRPPARPRPPAGPMAASPGLPRP